MGEKLKADRIKHSVLFVCTANQCRSPMAEGLLSLRVGVDNPDWQIDSAGTWANDGASASLNSVLVLDALGYDLRTHLSRTVNRDMIASHQLILVMERGHKEALRVEFPEMANRIYLLSEMINKVFNIDDPVGCPLAEYQATAREIDMILEQGFEKIGRLSDGD
jgi:protein-tyrosine-phosphatase